MASFKNRVLRDCSPFEQLEVKRVTTLQFQIKGLAKDIPNKKLIPLCFELELPLAEMHKIRQQIESNVKTLHGETAEVATFTATVL